MKKSKRICVSGKPAFEEVSLMDIRIDYIEMSWVLRADINIKMAPNKSEYKFGTLNQKER